ncbi:MAG: aldo/keto reductase [Candidatus Eisenbacteria bacterium]|uniref:Aldo/keto reductase n=1 Tax=Eiseniibacteriota bacterium TaxID=2212470 RepID=A0A538U2N4_UNCEI|nr:MAG: aldo/keto reductase [Candidatus Eisenbacteria bacterium]
MQTRNIGSLRVSVVGLGCNNFGRRIDAMATDAVVQAALDSGITFFDTADIYGEGQSEEFLGRALGARRADVVVATKFGMPMRDKKGARPAYLRAALDDSLRRLGTDHVDLYQLHQPDPETPIAETLATLDDLVKAGKVREIGCSNFSTDGLRAAREAPRPGAARFVSVQNEYSLLHRDPERGVVAECERQGLAFIPYFPLASGLLTGKYRKGKPRPQGTRLSGGPRGDELLTDSNLDIVEALIAFTSSRDRTLLELAISWLLSHSAVASVISGATRPDQVAANARAGSWRLSEAEMAEVDAIVHQSTG